MVSNWYDLRYAWRILIKQPGFFLVAAISLAFGIGSTSTVFCWMQSLLLRPFSDVPKQDRIVVVCPVMHGKLSETMSLPDLRDLNASKTVFEGVIGSQFGPLTMRVQGDVEWIWGQIVTANYFEVLGVKAALGRTIQTGEDVNPGGHPIAVISHSLWQRRFGGDPSVINKTIELNRHTFNIIGVMPPKFYGTMPGLVFDLWAPVAMNNEITGFGSLDHRGDHWMHTQARLKDGVNLHEAETAVTLVSKQLEETYPQSNRHVRFTLLPLWKSPYGGQSIMLPVLATLLAVCIFVLLIVSANVANLLLSRAAGRQKEMAVRLAIGASRARIIRQLMVESMTLAGAGGMLGLILSFWGLELLRFFMPPTHLPVFFTFSHDIQTLGFTILVVIASGVVFGLAPALQMSRPDMQSILKEGGRGTGASSAHHWIRNLLAISEVAIALLLVVCSGLCYKGFQESYKIDPGFDPEGILLGGMRLAAHNYTEKNAHPFYRELLLRIEELPGVTHAALANYIPLGFEGGGSTSFTVAGYQPHPTENMSANVNIISSGYFETMGIPILQGRDFQESDHSQSQHVVIINEIMAKQYWPGQNPIGRRCTPYGRDCIVVGVVKAGKYRFLNEPPQNFVYLPYQQGIHDLNLTVHVKTKGNPLQLAPELRQIVKSLDPNVALWAVLTMKDYMAASYLPQRITASLLVCLGALALILAAMGLYGVMACMVSQRTHEIGVRIALGAQNRDILRVIVGHGMILTAIGGAIGLVGSLIATRLLRSFLFGVSPFDPVTFLVSFVLLAIVAFIACYLPALRALKVDPMITLRYE